MIKFTNIKANNFLSYKELEFDLTNQGLTLIEGISDVEGFNANGCGKTVLLNTAVYALFGRLGQQAGVGSDDVVNRQAGKNTKVILEFDKDGTEYIIERYRKHTKHKNNVLLFENGKEITEGSVKETNQKIINILGIDYKTFANAIMVGGSDEPLFMDSTDKGKKEILEDITNISIYNKAQEVAKGKYNVAKDKVELLEKEIKDLVEKLDNYKELQEEEKNRFSQIEKQRKEENKVLENYKKEYAEGNFDEDIKKYEQEYNELTQKPFNTYENEISFIDKGVEEINDKIRVLEESVNEKIREVNLNINNLKSQITQLDTTDICPTCGSKLDATHAKNEYNRLEELIKAEQSKQNKIEQIKEENQKPLIEGLLANRRELDEKKQGYINLRDETSKATNDRLFELKSTIQDIRTNKLILSERIANQEKIINNLTDVESVKDYTKEIKETKSEIKKLKENIKEINQELEILEKVIDLYSRKGVQSTVLDMVVPFLNKSANHYLGKLSGGTLEVNFTTQIKNKSGELRDKFDVEVINERGGSSYGLSSQGEKRRIDVAVTLALQDLVMTNSNLETNIVFFDEVFEGLDDKGVEGVIEILREKSEIFESVFVITHNNSLKPLFDNTITVEKREGISKILSN